jgi:uncharacterized repeat protein (TIGR03803 family)
VNVGNRLWAVDYDLVTAQARALFEGERDAIANAANLSALIFEAWPELNWAGVEKVVHSFDVTDGEYPYDGLVALGGKLYGTTSGGGAHAKGTVFEVTP